MSPIWLSGHSMEALSCSSSVYRVASYLAERRNASSTSAHTHRAEKMTPLLCETKVGLGSLYLLEGPRLCSIKTGQFFQQSQLRTFFTTGLT